MPLTTAVRTGHGSDLEDLMLWDQYVTRGSDLGDLVLWDQYVTSFYFVNTIFYTVGFGDVVGTNNAEMLFCTFLFYLSALVFGTLLAEVQDALGRVRASSRNKENEVDFQLSQTHALAVSEMVMQAVPEQLKERLNVHLHDDLLGDAVPEQLKEQLNVHLHDDLLGDVELFQIENELREKFLLDLYSSMTTDVELFQIENELREKFLLDLYSSMTTEIFSAFMPIGSPNLPADRLLRVPEIFSALMPIGSSNLPADRLFRQIFSAMNSAKSSS
ncbi:hypothetical protein T484DRAFT_1857945 [Baffinella frigidus]|nr:hypothetical protein T484DRAFT_1857945 [Cryptophyta sp. CCMP2293]